MTEKYDRTFIAIDYGERRIGVAKSDPTGMIASALTTLEVKSTKESAEKIKSIIEEYHPNGLIFGYPLLRSGDKSDKCEEIDKFIEKYFGDIGIPVHRVDEYDSSNEAALIIQAHKKKTGHDKKRIDRLAAVIILQRFLEDNPA